MKLTILFALALAPCGEDAAPLATLDTATGYWAEVASTAITPYRSPQGAFARDCKKAKAKVCNWLTVSVDGEIVGNIDSHGNAVISNPDAVLKSLWYYAFHKDDAPTLHAAPAYPQDHPWPASIKTIAWDGETKPDTLATVEQLQAKVAEQSKQLAEAQAELRLYQQGLFQCQAAEIHAQAQQQAAKQRPLAPQEKK